MTLLDVMSVIAFVVWMWGCYVLGWSFSVKCLDFLLDEIDLYYERKYPDAI